jgi:hypothetical protein
MRVYLTVLYVYLLVCLLQVTRSPGVGVKSQGTLCSDAQSLHTGLHCINVCAECSEHSDCDGDSVYHYYSNSNMQLATGEKKKKCLPSSFLAPVLSPLWPSPATASLQRAPERTCSHEWTSGNLLIATGSIDAVVSAVVAVL